MTLPALWNLHCMYSDVTNAMAARSKVWVYGRSLAGIVGSNPARGMGVCATCEFFVCCQVEVSVTGRSLVQRSPIECGVSECVRGTS
jgi:hypothetical protein